MRHREGPQLHSWRGWDPPAVGEPGPQHRLFGVATAGVWLALRRPWENSLAPCFPTGTHSPPREHGAASGDIGCRVESCGCQAPCSVATGPRSAGRRGRYGRDYLGNVWSSPRGDPSCAWAQPQRLSAPDHPCAVYAPPALSPALGHSEADLTLSLCPRKVFSCLCLKDKESLQAEPQSSAGARVLRGPGGVPKPQPLTLASPTGLRCSSSLSSFWGRMSLTPQLGTGRSHLSPP